MNIQTETKNPREDEKPLDVKYKCKDTCMAYGRYDQKEKTSVTESVIKTYQNVITATRLGMSGKTAPRQLRKKNKAPKITKEIIKINAMIAK